MDLVGRNDLQFQYKEWVYEPQERETWKLFSFNLKLLFKIFFKSKDLIYLQNVNVVGGGLGYLYFFENTNMQMDK